MSSGKTPPAQEQLYESEDIGLELFWAKHQKTILVGAAALLIVVFAVAFWLFTTHKSRLAAEALFAEASTPEAWREVIARYPRSMPAVNARFLLADSLRRDGKLGESDDAYRAIIAEFPKHPLAGGARLGLAENLGLEGKTTEMVAALKELQAVASSSYAAPFAALLEGRVLMREGKLVEARRVFTTLISTYQTSPAAAMAGEHLEDILPLLPAAPAN